MLLLGLLVVALAVAIGVLVLLRRRRLGGTGNTVFEAVEKDHQAETGGQVIKQREAGFLNIVYGLAAAMVVADGHVEAAEIDVAEKLGKRLIPNFDDDAFVTVVRGHAKLPPFTEMVDTIAPLLPLEAKSEIFQYLQAIATADGKVTPDEKHYIHHVETAFGLDKVS